MSIKIEHVSFSYMVKTPNEVKALDDVSFEIKDNSITALIGHTGSGKSTLIQTLNALMIPSEGQIQVDDFLITNNPRKNKNIKALRRHIASIFQFPEYQLFEETVLKDVAFGPRNFGFKLDEATSKAKEALKLVGLDESYYERSPFELSGGERRKVAIAGILAIDPDILILDEPTAGLDYHASNEVMELVKEMHEKGKTIILVTHDMDLVYRYASKVFFIDKGKIEFSGTPLELFKKRYHALELPRLFFLATELIKRGIDIPLEEVKEIKDVIKYVRKER